MDIAPIVGIVVGVAGSETRSNQLSMVKNMYLDTKINLYDAREQGFPWELLDGGEMLPPLRGGSQGGNLGRWGGE